eukprot:gene38246-46476_t
MSSRIGPSSEVVSSESEGNKVDIAESLRDICNKKSSSTASQTLQRLIVEGKAPPLAYWFYISGPEKFSEKLIALWQNVGIVAALIGAISITVLLASPGATDAFVNSNKKFLSTQQSFLIARCYYIAWALATICELATVLLVTIANNHYYLMIGDEDIVWFIITWEFFITDFPQIFLVVGIFACLIGVMLGVYLICDMGTAYIVSGICSAIGCLVLAVWLYMLRVNKLREAAALAGVRSILIESMKTGK